MQFFDTNTFWGRVKERMWANGLTVKALSDRMGVSYKSMTNRISENRIPKKKGMVEVMAAELGCSVEYLMTGNKPEQNGASPDLNELTTSYKLLSEDRKLALLKMLRFLVKEQEDENEAYKRKHPELFRT